MNLLKTTWDNFKSLMWDWGVQMIYGGIYASVGVAFLAVIQGENPVTLLSGYEFYLAQVVLMVGLAVAFTKRITKGILQEDLPGETPTPTGEVPVPNGWHFADGSAVPLEPEETP